MAPVTSSQAPGGAPQASQLSAPAGLTSAIRGLEGGGAPMPSSLQTFFEPRFGHSFSAVRLHTGSEAAATADALAARAYTLGRNVVFGPGQYQPGTREGRQLLAHELAHVVQQTASSTSPPEPTLQRFAYGTGRHTTGGGNTFTAITAAERGGANGFDAAMRIVERVVNGTDWRANHCRQWFAGNCTDSPSPSLPDLHNRARLWMWRFADGAPRTGNNGLTDGAARANHGLNERVFNNRDRWETAAVMIHEYWHDCERGQPDIGDGAKEACGLPDT